MTSNDGHSAASTVVGGTELVLTDWRVLAVCGGINFETGGTMNVPVYFDPELDPELRATPLSAEFYKKYYTDPEMVTLAMKRARPQVRRSLRTTQILALDFASRTHDPYFDWVLHQSVDNLLPRGVRAMERMGRSHTEATAFLADLLSGLGQLDDWGEVNRQRFMGCRLLVDTGVAEKLSLASEKAPEQTGNYVSIYFRRFV